jgi:regulator of protease activity HflC (stomatin/prohibitin superfamily)
MDATPDDSTQAARASRLAKVGLGVQASVAAAALGTAIATGSFTVLAAAGHLAAGAGAWAAGSALASRRRRAADAATEERRLARLAEAEGRRPLFEPTSRGPSSDARLAAAFAIVLAAIEVALGVWLVAHGLGRSAGALASGLGGAALLAGSAFALLLLAKFTVALTGPSSASSPLALVAAGGRRAASGALGAFAAAIVLALGELAPSLELDRAGYVFAAVEVLLGVELSLSLLLELYRPRRRGEVPRPAFESRLLALVAEPGGIARSLARAVDYQFGFRLSETWVYRLIEGGIAPLALFAGAAFWLLSSLVVVPEGSCAILEKLGVPSSPALAPGLHAKLPWPLETVTVFPTARVREIVLGPDEDEHAAETGGRRRANLWTKAHAKEGEFFILVARPPEAAGDAREAPVDLLAARVPVHFIVSDPVAFARGAIAPEKFLKALGEGELAKLGCSRGLFDLLGSGAATATHELERRIQAAADEHKLGIRILDVSLADLHPPVEVARAFHAETAALEEREAQRLAELAYAAKLAPETRGRARADLDQARSGATRRKLLAQADASRFGALLALDRAAPSAFRTLRMLQGLADALGGPGRKIIVARGPRGAVDVDLGEKLSAEELGLGEGK